MSEDELADIAGSFLKRSPSNRLLYNALKCYHGIKYNFNELLIDDSDGEEMEMITETIPDLKNYNELNILDMIENINTDLVCALHYGYNMTINKFLYYIDDIRDKIFKEKNIFLSLGIGFTNTEYIEHFIRVCERICFGTLYFFIIANKNIQDKMDALRKIENKLEGIYNTLTVCEKTSREQYKKCRNFNHEYNGFYQNRAEDIMQYYVQYLNRKAFYEEIENIEDILKKEPFISDSSEERVISSLDKKREECKSLIEFSRKNGNYWGSCSDDKAIKIILYEGYISKVKYKRRTAMSIIRNILSEHRLCDKQELMFLDMKMLHGVFREDGMFDEYEVFLKICNMVRKMYLFAYSAIDDKQAYNLIHRTCFEFLYLFSDSKYTGVIIE